MLSSEAMRCGTSNDSETGSKGCPPEPISTLADLQIEAYENRVRKRLMAKYPTRTPVEARRLEKQIQGLVQIYLREEFSCWANQRIARAEVTIREELSKPQRLKSMMNGNNAQSRVPTLKDLYGPKQSSLPWEERQAEIVRFWIDSGDCWGFLFHHVSGTYFSAKEQRLLIDWPLGTIVVTGPKTLEFYKQFSNHRATLLRADGKDILSVRMHINSETQAERGAETITQAKEWEDLSP